MINLTRKKIYDRIYQNGGIDFLGGVVSMIQIIVVHPMSLVTTLGKYLLSSLGLNDTNFTSIDAHNPTSLLFNHW
jgi:hypothetical protein